MNTWTLLSTIVTFNFVLSFVQGKKIFCYYSSFAHTRQGIGNFLPENINPMLCTHLIFAFVEISPDGSDLVPFHRNDAGPNGMYARTLALKKVNPKLKVLLAVGGWQIGSKPFIPMIRNETTRRKWIKNVVRYVRSNGFDGFDMDWEFPATRGSPPEDKYRFTYLMKGLYEAFAEEAKESGKEKLILTLAAASGTYYIDQSYEPKKIINYIDYMLLMTYNYHGQWEKKTGHHSGLYAHYNDPKTGEKSQLYQEWSIDYWLDIGIPKEKLVVGLPTYAMTYTLVDPTKHDVHSPAAGGGKMGEFTKETGILAYYEICLNLMNKGWNSEWIDDQKVPYAYGGNQWAGYENRHSIALKSNNILKRNLAGAFVWSIEMDDFNGVCGDGPYPLLSTITNILDGTLSKSAARQSNSLPSKEVPKIIPPKSRLQPKVKNVNRNEVKSSQTSSEDEEKSGQVTTTKTPEEVTTEKKVEKNRVRWWTAPLWRKTATWKPMKASKSVGEPAAKEGHSRTNIFWRRKGLKNIQPVDSNSFKVTVVKPWHGLQWWSPLKASADSNKKHSLDFLGKSPTPEPISARPSMLAAYMGIIDARTDVCRKNGIGTFADPMSCDHFVICLSGNWLDIPPHVMACPVGTRFDANLRLCNYASHVECKN
ncbi:chitotriosidase-1-like [Biomphalaria glabrata]|uniref:Chitotriosidase-1-like n=2 Tax=Biomphalaria glabrata TaxID=6526 RepID=A0A9W2ZAD4_BIOGL|nr:chitotriosidase-1-like [Biomphalaria glabrata]